MHKGHIRNFETSWYNKIIKTFKNCRYVIIQITTERSDEILKNRKNKMPTLDETEHEVNMYNNLNLPVFNELPNFVHENIITIELEEVYKPDIKDIIEKINKKFNLNIPIDKAQFLHKFWYNSNIS